MHEGDEGEPKLYSKFPRVELIRIVEHKACDDVSDHHYFENPFTKNLSSLLATPNYSTWLRALSFSATPPKQLSIVVIIYVNLS